LDFYRRIVRDAAQYLNTGGLLAVEVGIHQAQAVAALAQPVEQLVFTEIIKDYSSIERVVLFQRS
jgi:release factor glutamine methyltransferase